MCKFSQFFKVLDPIWYLPLAILIIAVFLSFKFDKLWLKIVSITLLVLLLVLLYYGCLLVSSFA